MNEPCPAPLCDYCDRWWRDCRCRAALGDDIATARRMRRAVEERHRAARQLACTADAHRARRVAAARLDALQMKETTR